MWRALAISAVLHGLAVLAFTQIPLFSDRRQVGGGDERGVIQVLVGSGSSGSSPVVTDHLVRASTEAESDDDPLSAQNQSAQPGRENTSSRPLAQIYRYLYCQGYDHSYGLVIPDLDIALDETVENDGRGAPVDCERIDDEEGSEVVPLLDLDLLRTARAQGWIAEVGPPEQEWMVIARDGGPRHVGDEIFGPFPWEQ